MKRLFTGIASAAILAAVPSPSTAQTCRYVNLSVVAADLVYVDPLPGFYECISVPVIGTLRGTLFSCFRLADLFTSDAIWHDGNQAVLAAWWYDEIRTRDGTISIVERGMADLATGVQSTLMSISGGSGSFSEATGVLTLSPEWPNRTASTIQGTLCTP